MEKIVAVRLKHTGKAENFDSAGIPAQLSDWVVVQGPHGPELGWVSAVPRDPTPEEAAKPPAAVLRIAKPEDHQQYQKLEKTAFESLATCREQAKKLNLAMKPIAAHYVLDGNHLTIYFVAEERVDFRDLVRELRQTLRTRVELRQVGPRDEAKLIGALGKCGRRLCCMTWIEEFTPISIRMAKDQDLSLSPMKVSGVCGRLLCCLGYEADFYRNVREKSPRVGQEASAPQGKGRVVSINPLRETVLLDTGSEQAVEVPVAQLTWERKAKPPPPRQEPRKSEHRGRDRGPRPEQEPEKSTPEPVPPVAAETSPEAEGQSANLPEG